MSLETLAALLIQVIRLGLTTAPAIVTAVGNLYDAVIKGEEPTPEQVKTILDAIAEKQAALSGSAGA